MELVVLATLHDSFQVQFLKDILLNEGIKSIINDRSLSSEISGLFGYHFEISVFKKDFERAKEIFENGFPQEVT